MTQIPKVKPKDVVISRVDSNVLIKGKRYCIAHNTIRKNEILLTLEGVTGLHPAENFDVYASDVSHFINNLRSVDK